ncbi:PfkB family carbohydrate kinase [Lactobacillaceae bacterium Melli_B4]
MKVLGIGDNVVDMYLDKGLMYLGGNALNFSVFSSKLGNDAAFIGVFGTDHLASYAKTTLANLDVDISHSKTIQGENGYSKVTIENGERVFVTSNTGGVLNKGINLNQSDIDYMNQFDVVHFNINGHANEYISKVNGPRIVYDFSNQYTDDDISQIAPKVDLACFSGENISEDEVPDFIKKVASLGVDTVLCTKGSDGAWVYTASKLFYEPALIVKATDTMGAGDSFITSFTDSFYSHYLSEYDKIPSDLTKATRFAAKQVQTNGSFGYGESF